MLTATRVAIRQPHRTRRLATTALLGLHLVPATVMISTLMRSLRSHV